MDVTNQDKLTPDEITSVAGLLARFDPGFLPYPIFEQIGRLVVFPILEIVPLRKNAAGGIEVLLLERTPDYPAIFDGMLHTPGTVIRATDVNRKTGTWPALERIIADELNGTQVGNPYYVGSILHASKRGAEQAQVYWVEVQDKPKIGRFYGVDILPENLMDSQRNFIKQSVESFRTHKAA
jgi:hypothetical protein